MTLTIRTNNQPRDVLYWWELTDKERKELDYHNPDEAGAFVRYKKTVYDLGEFMRCSDERNASPSLLSFKGWHGYQSDSCFSGVLCRYVDRFERVIMGDYYG